MGVLARCLPKPEEEHESGFRHEIQASPRKAGHVGAGDREAGGGWWGERPSPRQGQVRD